MSSKTSRMPLSRRRFLTLSAMGGSAFALAACGGGSEPEPTAAPDPTEEPTAVPEPTAEPTAEPTEAPAAAEEPAGEVKIMVGDVQEYVFGSDDWAGGFGSVTIGLHEAMYNGESVYHIRTDASDPTVAEEIGLVYVPLLNAAAGLDDGEANTYYALDGDRPAVFAKIPGDENFTSLCKWVNVTGGDESLNSVEAIMDAVDAGDAEMEETNVFVNYPFIQWPGGGMSVDPDLNATLENGQLFAEPDLDAMTVTMKMHQCYPGSRYIVTDAGGMAGMMNLAEASVTNKLHDLGGTDEIWVFGNGIPGPGAMGHQPAIFDNEAGQPAWSPFWDHRTIVWKDDAEPRVLTNSDEVRAAIEAGEVDEFMGVPDSHPNGFVVNCPAVILAPNDFTA